MFIRKIILAFVILLYSISIISIHAEAVNIPMIIDWQYVYEMEGELQQEVKESIEKVLHEFDVQTRVQVVVINYQGTEILKPQEIFKKLCKSDLIVILFSRYTRTISCSEPDIDISRELKSMLSANTNDKYNETINKSTISILNKIANEKHLNFRMSKEKFSYSDYINKDDVEWLIQIIAICMMLICIPISTMAITIWVFKLCISELIEAFSDSRFY